MPQPNYVIRGREIDHFTRAYMEAILFGETDDSDEPLDHNYGIEDFAESTINVIVADCKRFQELHADDIKDDIVQAGYDFYFTRQYCGCGFWETPDWPGEAGKRMTATCEKFGHRDFEIGDDGLIHQFPEKAYVY